MSKKDTALFLAMLLCIAISVAALYYRSIVLQDFELMILQEDEAAE